VLKPLWSAINIETQSRVKRGIIGAIENGVKIFCNEEKLTGKFLLRFCLEFDWI
jgi:hypothetical protein